ncbi:MAG: hypothetical protein ACTSXQ_07315 [Alphaproteobacteria bacterium]
MKLEILNVVNVVGVYLVLFVGIVRLIMDVLRTKYLKRQDIYHETRLAMENNNLANK